MSYRALGQPMTVSEALRAIEAVEEVPPAEIPTILGDLERIRALLFARMWMSADIVKKTPEAAAPSLLTINEVAAMIRFSRGHVYELVRNGSLPAIRKARSVRVSPADLAEWQRRYQTRPVDDTASVSLESPRDWQGRKAHPRVAGPEPAGVRRAPRRSRDHRG